MLWGIVPVRWMGPASDMQLIDDRGCNYLRPRVSFGHAQALGGDEAMIEPSATVGDRPTEDLPAGERLAPAAALAEAHNAVARALHRLALEPSGLDAATADLLVQLARSPECGIRGVQIRERCQMTATRVSRLVDRAEAEGLVKRQPDPLDRRAQHVALTERGREVARRYAPLMDDVLRKVFVSGLSQRDCTTLVALLDRVRDRARQVLATGDTRA